MFFVLLLCLTSMVSFDLGEGQKTGEVFTSSTTDEAKSWMDEEERLAEHTPGAEAAAEKRVKRSDDTLPLETVVANLAQELSTLKAQLQAAENKIAQEGSTYIRWGRSVCPSTSELVYAGVAGGSKYSETGGASNRLCLSRTPQFDDAAVYNGHHVNIHGAEYYIPGHDHPDVPCAVCRAPHPTTLMIPGTKTCPPGWTPQYSGHITAQKYTYPSNSEFLCLDGNPEDREGSGQHYDDGAFFMYSTASCGSLPCPPYVNGKVVTCVVCSK